MSEKRLNGKKMMEMSYMPCYGLDFVEDEKGRMVREVGEVADGVFNNNEVRVHLDKVSLEVVERRHYSQSAAEIDEMKPAPDEYMLAAAEKGTFGQKTWVCPDKSQILIEVRVNKQSKTCLI
ncbi:hypothetical protein P8452_08329 [Trifolium repens]|nr:hypothetical protein P8452_08329 [Trifolium repens]